MSLMSVDRQSLMYILLLDIHTDIIVFLILIMKKKKKTVLNNDYEFEEKKCRVSSSFHCGRKSAYTCICSSLWFNYLSIVGAFQRHYLAYEYFTWDLLIS